jgi:hypothetical protein
MGSCGRQPNNRPACQMKENRREMAAIVIMVAYIPLAVCESASMAVSSALHLRMSRVSARGHLIRISSLD